VEFHRFGGKDILRPDSRYIRTAGWDCTAQEVAPGLDHEDLLRALNALRYGVGSAQDIDEARARLATEAARFLDKVTTVDGELQQVDLVTNAGELWAFPFEACYERHPDWLQHAQSGVVITRRIRGEFSAAADEWPAVPRVLFAHAPVEADLDRTLIDAHRAGLHDALTDWYSGNASKDGDLLHVREVASLVELGRACAELRPTSVHLLAHGAPTPGDPLLPGRVIWGLRLGYAGEVGSSPAEVSEALCPDAAGPRVVTLAACDSANAAGSVFAVQSVAQELHRRGVPVVVGSQLPLTKAGSLVLVRSFYSALLRGADVRAALHAARARLHEETQAHHDWLSLVGYVRLPPEGYAEHLDVVGLKMELRMLEAAQSQADRLSRDGGSRAAFADVEARLQARLDSLQDRKARLSHRTALLEECLGLEASAYKRLAELLFQSGRHNADAREDDWRRSRDSLTASLDRYRSAYESNLQSHWLGVQRLSLEAVLAGAASLPGDWLFTRRAAEIAADRRVRGAYWSHGTLAELFLLAPCAGQPRDLERAKAALTRLMAGARAADDAFAIESTRRQLRRYVQWWTNAHGYFPGRDDLSRDAEQLLLTFD
jgi:hypothetical protein